MTRCNPARERLGLFGCAAIFASSAHKCQGFCHFMPEKRVRCDVSKRQRFWLFFCHTRRRERSRSVDTDFHK